LLTITLTGVAYTSNSGRPGWAIRFTV